MTAADADPQDVRHSGLKEAACEELVALRAGGVRSLRCGRKPCVGGVALISDEYGGVKISPRCREHLDEYWKSRGWEDLDAG